MTIKSEKIGELAKALAKAQGDIKSAIKDATNPFFKSSYADLPAIVKACKEALAANGIAYVQAADFDGEAMWLETILMHTSDQWISGRYPIKPVKSDPQGVGSATTYARRYSLAAMVGVVAENEDDDGNAASGHASDDGSSPPKPDRKAAVKSWGEGALKTISEFQSVYELSEWHRKNANAVAATREFNETLHGKLIKALQDRQAEFDKTTR